MSAGDRVIEFSQGPCEVSRRGETLVVRAGTTEATLALQDLAVVVLGHPAARVSAAALAGCAEHGVMVVVCDARFHPAAMLMPLTGHHVQAERFRHQVASTLPRRKRAWQQLVQAKVRGQASVLRQIKGEDGGLWAMADDVRSGDTTNLEAQAARRYWRLLYGKEFRRDPLLDDYNRHLNYGYAVLRAATARALVGAGLHPSFGLHHHNRYDAFVLADDVMEPFRPAVDLSVARMAERGESAEELSREDKETLVEAALGRVTAPDGERTIPDCLARLFASLYGLLVGEQDRLFLPAWP